MGWDAISEFVADTARIGGQLMTIGGVVGMFAYKPYKNMKKKQQERREAEKARDKRIDDVVTSVAHSADCIKEVKKTVVDIGKSVDDVRDIVTDNSKQIARLDEESTDLLRTIVMRRHDALMVKGWATDTEKSDFGAQVARLKMKDNGQVPEAFLNDVLRLPSYPTMDHKVVDGLE